jgi:hypothetical protein
MQLCSILSKTHVDANLAGRIQVIGWSFDRPTEEKQRLIRALLWERRRISRDSA